ncbi:MAG: FkbM family methyltransferase [Saprospiraceae bacterium]
MKKLRKLLSGLKHRLLGARYKVVDGALAGRSLRVIRGTLSPAADKDDAWLFYLMGRFERIFDIGANIGQSALMAKVQGADKRLLLADPNPEALSLAAKNLILNGWATSCDFVTAFVGDADGEKIKFWTVGAGAAGSMYKGHAATAAAAGLSAEVPTVRIDTLVLRIGWTPELVKIDVEGAEAKVLKGATQLAAQRRAWFMVEMHSPPELPMTENAALVLDWAKSVGYTVWYMRDACLLTTPKALADRGRCHLLLLPQGLAYPADLAQIRENSPLPQS